MKRISDAARIAKDGDTIEVDSGIYAGDVATWTQRDLIIRGIGGRVRLRAAGAAAEGKAIWVVRGDNVTVENFAFQGARVADGNGAGIRHERGKLLIRGCTFSENENGILTANDSSMELVVENSEFGYNGAGDGLTHNLYVGAISRLAVRGSYFHHANGGHLIKSRARENYIFYNRLTDEAAGRASYELEFPNGGLAVAVGNIIQQTTSSENSNIISFGAEGYKWPVNELYLSHNTVANDRLQGGVFVSVKAGKARAKLVNNLFLGRGSFEIRVDAERINNLSIDSRSFAAPDRLDYRLRHGAPMIGTAVPAGDAHAVSLRPDAEYSHPASVRPLAMTGSLSPGAVQAISK